jgi:putative membrane protein
MMNLQIQRPDRNSKYRYLLIVFFLTASCAGEHTGGKDTEIDEESRQDKTFAVEATYSNLAEIEMGRLAQSKAVSEDVIQFAETMVKEHTAALQELRSISDEQGIEIPDTLSMQHKRIQDELAAYEGEAFDSAYMHQQIQAHQQAERLFQRETDIDSHPGYATYAKTTLEHVQSHLARAREIVDAGKNPTSVENGNNR